METKKWYQSKTIWGIMIAFLSYFMINIVKVSEPALPTNPDYTQLKAYVDAIKDSNGNLSVIIAQIMGMAGTLLAIYGRVKAETNIK